MTESRIIGHMVTRNEMDRYLPATIEWLRTLVNDLFVYDDLSTDGTFEHLRDLGVPAKQRSAQDFPFQENEGIFRMVAWWEMEAALRPTTQDWVLCVDADELLLGNGPCDTRSALAEQVEVAKRTGIDAVTFEVAEAFDLVDGRPQIRTDGFWGHIRACRLVRWRNESIFHSRDAGGSVPNSWTGQECVSLDLVLLHLGYVRAVDRQVKHDRYTGRSGHSRRHVESILWTPTLRPWTGQPLPVDIPA